MMHNWFECKVSYEKIMEDRKAKESDGALFG